MTISQAFETYFNTLQKDSTPRYNSEVRFMESIHSQFFSGRNLTDKQLRLLKVITYQHEDKKYDYVH